MKRLTRQLGLFVLATLLSIGTVACGNSDGGGKDDGGGPDDGPTPSVTVEDQSLGDASKVQVPKATSPGDGWLVIHEQKEDEKTFGAVIGHTSLEKGENTDVEVGLDRDAEAGERLYAMLHEDTGEEGTYEFSDKGDADPPVKKDGEIAVKSFEITEQPQEPSLTTQERRIGSEPGTVTVASAVSPGGGWLVIHEQKEDEETFGAVIGHTSLEQGENKDISVELDRDAEVGETLYAMLHEDTGEEGTYEFGDKDGADPPVKKDGEIVLDSFELLHNPSVEASDKTIDTSHDEVTVDGVTTPNGGWLVIHEQKDGEDAFGAVIGHTAIDDGEQQDVTVELDRDVEDGETLYAMPHRDGGEKGTYEFGDKDGADQPYKMDGDIVVDSFEVTLALGG